MEWTQPIFWLTAWQLILVNIVLSGDNALVIALACRSLPGNQRFWGMIIGAGAAVLLRIIFVGIVTEIMDFPLLKLVGGILLLWIAIKLVLPAEPHDDGKIEGADNLWRAVKIVAVADVVMSLDNVIAIAAAAKGNWLLIVFGLTVGIPLIVASSAVLVALLERYQILVWGGAALLGWIAGEIIFEDPAFARWLGPPFTDAFQYVTAELGSGFFAGEAFTPASQYLAAGSGALFVVTAGYILTRLRQMRGPAQIASSPRASVGLPPV
jgi:YjbE family integral membrane protein